MTSSTRRATGHLVPALVCAAAGAAVFQFFGNANHGYIDTSSLFYWWGYQWFLWFDPRSETQHGPVILAVCVWLFWRNLREGRSLLAGDGSENRLQAGSYAPLIAMAAGLALHAIGFAAQQARLSIVALLIFSWGVLRFGGGRRWGAAAMFPLAMLVFAIPVDVLNSVGFWLRMGVIDTSARLAHVAGIGVLQSGTQLLAPDGRYNYDVAAACSGVRSLTALAALALLAGYLNFRSWWRRGIVVLSCFPLVVLGNIARITSIIFAAQWGGQAWGEHAHTVMGYGVFLIVLGGVLGVVNALQRWWPESGDASQRRPEVESANRIGTQDGSESRPYLVAATLVVLAVGEMFFLHHLATMPPRGAAGVLLTADGKNPVELPAFLGIEWTGVPEAVTALERDMLPADTGFSRKTYFSHRDPAKRVFVSIVLSGRDRTSIHRPEICLVGQGWTIDGATPHQFAFPAPPATEIPATLLHVKREVVTPRGRARVPQLVAYWFVNGDTVVATHWQRLVIDAWNRVMHARVDRWAYVLVQTDAADGEAAATARMQAVLSEVVPAFERPLTVQ